MTSGGEIRDHYIDSQALERRMCVRIATPPDYNSNAPESYRVLYFLHPWGLSPHYITDKLNIHLHAWAGIEDGTLPPMVIVLPTGDKSFYVNAVDPPGYDWRPILESHEEFFRDALTQSGRYGDYLLDEVIPYVEKTLPVCTDRAGRAIGGISMGGAGAAVHGFRDVSRFCAVGIHSPAVFRGTADQSGPPWIFGVERGSFAARNPADIAAKLPPAAHPRIYLDCGDEDAMLDTVEHLHHVLTERGITHHYQVSPGGHDKTYWEPRMRQYLAFYAQDWM